MDDVIGDQRFHIVIYSVRLCCLYLTKIRKILSFIVVNYQQNVSRSQWILLMYSKFRQTYMGRGFSVYLPEAPRP
jgi:hypothetical protein